MRFNRIRMPPAERAKQDVFGGYNHNLRAPETDFYDEINLTSDLFPVLSPRKQRGIYKADGTVSGMCSQYGQLCYISDDRYFHVGDRKIDFGEKTLEHHDRRQMIPFGRDVIVLPDRIYIKEREDGALSWGWMAAERRAIRNDGTAGLCTTSPAEKDGRGRDIKYTGSDTPVAPEDGDYWAKPKPRSDGEIITYKFSGEFKRWVEVPSIYEVAFVSEDPTPQNDIKDGDTVRIKITAKTLYSQTGEELDPKVLKILNGAVGIYHKYQDDYYGGFFLIVNGYCTDKQTKFTAKLEDGVVLCERYVPELDYACVSGNRLWGCRYGDNGVGDTVNEIYASAPGKYLQWGTFEGVGSDAYALNVGSDGPFTAAVAFKDSVWFFKEHIVHRVLGSLPRNFRTAETVLRGVQRGSAGSVAIINETLYYKSPEAVCAFDGSLPVKISDQLGDARYQNAVGGGFDRKYYISMQQADGSFQCFDYDVEKGIWHKQDDGEVRDYCAHNGDIYAANASGIYTMLGGGTLDRSPVGWYAETGAIGVALPDHKYLQRLNIRADIPLGSEIRVLVQYDESDSWNLVYTGIGNKLGSRDIAVSPRRCDHFRLRLEGIGPCTVYSFVKTFRLGGTR